MREGKLAIFFAGTLTLLSADALAGSAPKELFGKSIVLTWGESREGVKGNDSAFICNEHCSVYVVLTTYVSTAGRLFTMSLHGATVTSHVTHSQVGFEGPGDRSAHSSAEFQGHSLVMTSQLEGGARRIVVEFNPAFSTCEGRAMLGKELGKNTMHVTGVSGQQIELHSVSISGVTCAIKEGNALGDFHSSQ